jgi:hypothetical protein
MTFMLCLLAFVLVNLALDFLGRTRDDV